MAKVYAVYSEVSSGAVDLVEVLSDSKQAKDWKPSSGYILKAWNHLTRKQVECLSYVEAMFFDMAISEALSKE